MDSGDTLEVGSGFDIMGRSAGYGRQVIRRRIIKGRRHRAAQGSRTARGRSPFYAILKTKDVTAGRPSEGHQPGGTLAVRRAGGREWNPAGLARQFSGRKAPTK